MEKNEEIRISPDALIAMVVAEAEARELAAMPSVEELDVEFKPTKKFQRKMEKLLQKARRKKAKTRFVKTCKKGFVTVVSLISILSCTMLPVKAVREAVVETLIDWQEKFVAIVFVTDDERIRIPQYITDTYIPNGFSLVEPVSRREDSYYARYMNLSGQYYTVQALSIDNTQSFALDNEYTAYYSIEFKQNQAIWGVMQDGNNALVWESNGLSFQVIGSLDLSEIIKVAENIQISDAEK